MTIQAGANAVGAIKVTMGGDLSGAYVPASGSTAASGGLGNVISTSGSGASAVTTAAATSLTDHDNAIALISNRRASLGAARNQLQSAMNNLTSGSTTCRTRRAGFRIPTSRPNRPRWRRRRS